MDPSSKRQTINVCPPVSDDRLFNISLTSSHRIHLFPHGDSYGGLDEGQGRSGQDPSRRGGDFASCLYMKDSSQSAMTFRAYFFSSVSYPKAYNAIVPLSHNRETARPR